MVTEQYLNAPTKSCHTCIHKKGGGGAHWDFCKRHRVFCSTAVSYHCGRDLKDWKQKPPRRSLRRWLLDVIWA